MEQEFKLVVMGTGGVGKSALTIRMVRDKFLADYDPTIEDTYRKHIVVDDKTTLLSILDTAGQDEFKCMRDQWISDGDGFVLVYSIISDTSLKEMKQVYNHIERLKEGKELCVVVCGNKADLDGSRQVTYEDGAALAKEWDCNFYETSAKTGLNSEAPFIELVRTIRKVKNKKPDPGPKGKLCTLL